MNHTPSWQHRYSLVFVGILIVASILTLSRSLKGGVAELEGNFIGRQPLIAYFNRLRYSLGDRVYSQVLAGDDGWLEFTSDGNLNDYQNAAPMLESLEALRWNLETLHADLSARGITLIVVVAPNKATIYPEHMPDAIEKLGEQSRLDAFLALMEENNATYVLDLRPSLMQARQDHQLYYKTDTHWNSLGAYLAYQDIMNAASQAYPELQPYELDQFRWKETEPEILDLARLMGVSFIRETRNELQPKFDSQSHMERIAPQSNFATSWANDGQQRTLLMYHDSFGISLLRFLSFHFKQGTYIQNSYTSAIPKLDWIDVVDPDVVILEIVERNLPYLNILFEN